MRETKKRRNGAPLTADQGIPPIAKQKGHSTMSLPMYLTMWKDVEGLPRAWAAGNDREKVEAYAKEMIEQYVNDGRNHADQKPFTSETVILGGKQ